jgi:predicted lactoylglutathione lyase
MATAIFINLPVKNLDKSRAFYGTQCDEQARKARARVATCANE